MNTSTVRSRVIARLATECSGIYADAFHSFDTDAFRNVIDRHTRAHNDLLDGSELVDAVCDDLKTIIGKRAIRMQLDNMSR